MHHKTAIISKGAKIDTSVKIGAYAIIENDVTINKDCEIAAHAQILSGSMIGNQCFIGQSSVIGGLPQDRSFDKNLKTGVKIGNKNILREYVTVNRSSKESKFTIIGDNNMLMAGVHLGHDVIIGNSNNIANNCLFGGFSSLGDNSFIGGGTGFHQFIRVGSGTMVQGNAGFSKDLPPYLIGRDINKISGLNLIGMKRLGIEKSSIVFIKNLFKQIYLQNLSPKKVFESIDESKLSETEKQFYDFFKSPSLKGICLKFNKNS